MSERSELNADPLAEKLGRFTPDTAGFDRDALLFQAGRASVGPRRFWPLLAGALAISQAATLLFFLGRTPQPSMPEEAEPRELAPILESAPALPTPSPAPAPESRKWSYRRPLLTGDLNDLPSEEPAGNSAVPDRPMTIMAMFSAYSVE